MVHGESGECCRTFLKAGIVSYPWLLPLGILVGAFGTLIGAGGGFLLVPLLLLLYPNDSPETITSISLAVVFLNALSGSAAYARMKRIDYRSGLIFAAAAVPGAILGALVTSYLPRRVFDAIFGLVLVVIAGLLLANVSPDGRGPVGAGPGHTQRTIVDADGDQYTYSYNLGLGVLLSVVVGFLSSLLGIGGGIIHVPGLVYLLNFPPHIATATSHFILAFLALAGTGVHVSTGAFVHGVRRTAWLGAGALVGAQAGARLSTRVHGKWIIRSLALGLAFVGIRILLLAL